MAMQEFILRRPAKVGPDLVLFRFLELLSERVGEFSDGRTFCFVTQGRGCWDAEFGAEGSRLRGLLEVKAGRVPAPMVSGGAADFHISVFVDLSRSGRCLVVREPFRARISWASGEEHLETSMDDLARRIAHLFESPSE